MIYSLRTAIVGARPMGVTTATDASARGARSAVPSVPHPRHPPRHLRHPYQSRHPRSCHLPRLRRPSAALVLSPMIYSSRTATVGAVPMGVTTATDANARGARSAVPARHPRLLVHRPHPLHVQPLSQHRCLVFRCLPWLRPRIRFPLSAPVSTQMTSLSQDAFRGA